MRIAVLLGARHNINTDQRVLRTVRALSEAGYEVRTYSPQNVPPLAENRIAKKLQLDYALYNLTLARAVMKDKCNICHCNDLDTLLAGVIVKMLSGGRVKVVYDSHEDYPAFVKGNHGKAMGKVAELIERTLAPSVDRGIAAIPWIEERLRDRGVRRVVTVLNCQEMIEPCHTKYNRFTVAYQGNPQQGRGYEMLPEIAKELRDRGLKVRLLVIGDYRVKAEGVTCAGFLEHGVMMKVLQKCHAGLILFEDRSDNNRWALPNKLFENLAAGIPTIAGDLPGMRDALLETGAGMLVSGNVKGNVVKAIEELYRDRGRMYDIGNSARLAAQYRYNFGIEKKKLLAVYRGVEQ